MAALRCDFDVVEAHTLDEAAFNRTYRHKRPVLLTFAAGAADLVAARVRQDGYQRLRDYFASIPMSGGTSDLIPVFQGAGICWRPFKDWWRALRPVEQSVSDATASCDDQVTSTAMYVFEAVPSAVLSRALTGVPKYLNAFAARRDDDTPAEEMRRAKETDVVDHDQSTIYFGAAGSGIGWHAHGDGFNVLLEGTKRWLVFDPFAADDRMAGVGRPSSIPGYSVSEWLSKVRPFLAEHSLPAPLECEQPAGSIVYLPDDWPHAVQNCAPTLGFAFQRGAASSRLSLVGKADALAVDAQALADDGASATELASAVAATLEATERAAVATSAASSGRMAHVRADVLRLRESTRGEALRWYDRVIDDDPFAIGAMVAASWLAEALGDDERARAYVQRALQLNPTSSLALTRWGAAMGSRGDGSVATEAALPLLVERQDLASLRAAFENGECAVRDRPPVWHPLTATPWAPAPLRASMLARQAFFTKWLQGGAGPALADDSLQGIDTALWAPQRYAGSGCELRRVDASTLDQQGFTRDVLLAQQPVVLVGEPGCARAADEVERQWSDDALVRRAGDRTIIAESSSDRNSSFYRGPMHPAKSGQRTVEEKLETFLRSRYRHDERESNWYLQSTILPESAPLLPRPRFDGALRHMGCKLDDGTEEEPSDATVAAAVDPEGRAEQTEASKVDRRWCGRMWLGLSDGAQVSHLHRDVPDNLHCVVEGRKLFTVIEPNGVTASSAHGWGRLYSPLNVHSATAGAAALRKRQCVIEPGEYLFLPSMHWHAVVSLAGRNLGVNFWYQPQRGQKKRKKRKRVAEASSR